MRVMIGSAPTVYGAASINHAILALASGG